MSIFSRGYAIVIKTTGYRGYTGYNLSKAPVFQGLYNITLPKAAGLHGVTAGYKTCAFLFVTPCNPTKKRTLAERGYKITQCFQSFNGAVTRVTLVTPQNIQTLHHTKIINGVETLKTAIYLNPYCKKIAQHFLQKFVTQIPFFHIPCAPLCKTRLTRAKHSGARLHLGDTHHDHATL